MIEIAESLHPRYDRNGVLERVEALGAVADYRAGRIEKDAVLEVVLLHFAG